MEKYNFTYSSRVYLIATFAALASVLQVLEIFIVLPIPFIKIGLANTITLFFLYKKEYLIAFLITVIRLFVGGFFAGKLLNIIFIFSLSGGIISFSIMFMLFLFFRKVISLTAISISGAVAHNFTQLFLFYSLTGYSVKPDMILSSVLLLSVAAGLITAYVARKMVSLPVKFSFKKS